MLEWRWEAGEWRTLAEQRAAAYRLLCGLVGGRPSLEHDEKGAPFLPEYPNLYISISHCRVAVAVAVCDKVRVGIDVESRRRIDPSLVGRVCTADERRIIESASDPTMAFLQLWTRKEAVLKMRGTGIQGFGSMVQASAADDCQIVNLDICIPDVVAALATGV